MAMRTGEAADIPIGSITRDGLAVAALWEITGRVEASAGSAGCDIVAGQGTLAFWLSNVLEQRRGQIVCVNITTFDDSDRVPRSVTEAFSTARAPDNYIPDPGCCPNSPVLPRHVWRTLRRGIPVYC